MNQKQGLPESFEEIYVARQPIFTGNLHVWGYELLFRHSARAQGASFQNGDSASAKVILDGFAIAQEGLADKVRTFINFSRQMILDDIPYSLPRGQVVELLEDIVPDDEFVNKCLELRKDYVIAVDDYLGQEGWEKVLDLAHIIKVDVLALSPEDLVRLSTRLQAFTGKLLAEKVEDQAMFSMARDLGFQLFQGFFFSKPEVLTGRKLSSNEMSRLELLSELGQQEIDHSRLKSIIQSDVSIIYRLLTYINSPGFGLMIKVKSIEHALNMLGERQIRQWLRVLILADFDSSPKGREVIQSSATRAFFLSNMAEFYRPPLQIDTLFTIGLLSMLDALLNQPMKAILELVPLEDEVKDVLLEQGSEAGLWLELVKHFEFGQWQEVDLISKSVGFADEKIAQSYSRALIQSRKLLGGHD